MRPGRWRVAPISACLAALLAATPAVAQVDMEVMQKWATVQVVHYDVVGVYSADTMVVNAGTNGYSEVKDRVEIALDWDQTEAKLVGEPTIANFPSGVSPLRNGADGCRAPTLNGSYEHFTALSVTEAPGGQLAMSVQRDFPGAEMPVACTGGSESVPSESTTENEELGVPGVMILAMPVEPGGPVAISSDGSSIILVDGGWTWTYTPTPVR